MIPNAFEYAAPATLEEALKLAESADSKLLAGGMSLIPLMKLRLASPEAVIDLGRVPGLSGISESAGVITIGAMTTHHSVETSPLVRGKIPLMAETAGRIGDVQVRNMGTIGGSVAHADPAADYPAALVALEAIIHLRSASGDRTVEASEFFLGAFTTAMEPGEIIVDVQIRAEKPSEGFKYEKLPHPASGFPVVGVAARIQQAAGKFTLARIGVTGMASHAFRAVNAEKILEGGGTVTDACAVIAEGVEANSDLYASADYRKHLARVYAARAVTAAISRAS
jgi:aerobic carbon-monoxide dehydrogenase medium subunit